MRTILALTALALTVVTWSEPKIQSVQPDRIAVSARVQPIVITGENFEPGLTLVVLNPAGKSTTYSGQDITGRTATTFRVSLPFDTAGAYELVAANADGGRSTPFRIDVKKGANAPMIERVQPDEIRRSQEAQVITIRGAGFQPGLRVTLTDPTGTVTVTDAFDRLESSIVVARLVFEISGVYGLTVANSSGESSNSISLTIR
ncbi:MAG TPA: hypothetical protein VN700_06935 [Vicinamibacterales bacterium]|nr:hypothetical protein [Vicinamibacterales bacterium]